jgi:hypothetical protein
MGLLHSALFNELNFMSSVQPCMHMRRKLLGDDFDSQPSIGPLPVHMYASLVRLINKLMSIPIPYQLNLA